jgi:hypothetical protein
VPGPKRRDGRRVSSGLFTKRTPAGGWLAPIRGQIANLSAHDTTDATRLEITTQRGGNGAAGMAADAGEWS